MIDLIFVFGGTALGTFVGFLLGASGRFGVTVRQSARVGNGGVVVQSGNIRIAGQGSKKPDAGRCEYCGAQKG